MLTTPESLSCSWSMVQICDFRTREPLAMGLFELRPRGRSGIGRAFYCFVVGKRIVVLHAFIKKSQSTPDRELKLARKRMKECLHG